MTYGEKLKDPRWQKKRLEILERDKWTCLICDSKDKTLHVHHGYYKRGVDPWDYPDWSLKTLCSPCHEKMGDIMSLIQQIISGCGVKLVYNMMARDNTWQFSSFLQDFLGKLEEIRLEFQAELEEADDEEGEE